MIILDKYDIDPFYSNKLLRIKLYFLNLAGRFKQLTSIKAFKTGLADNLINRDFGKILIMTEGLKQIVAEFNQTQAAKEYRVIEKSLHRFIKIHSLLEGIDFFDNPDMQVLADNILSNLYFLESKLRHLSFTEISLDPKDDELKEVSSFVSRKNTFINSDVL